MSKFRDLFETENQPKFNPGDIVKTKPLINNTSSTGTIVDYFIVHGITVYNVQFIIPNIHGPFTKNPLSNNPEDNYYHRIDKKPYTTKIRQIAEEFLELGTEEELNTEIEKATIETEKWK